MGTRIAKWGWLFCVLGICAWLTWQELGQPSQHTRIYVGPILGAVALCLWLFLLRPVVDEVLDAGDALLVRRGRTTQRVAFADILAAVPNQRRHGVQLMLRGTGPFGDSILFHTPLADWRGTTTSAIADELDARARSARAAEAR